MKKGTAQPPLSLLQRDPHRTARTKRLIIGGAMNAALESTTGISVADAAAPRPFSRRSGC